MADSDIPHYKDIESALTAECLDQSGGFLYDMRLRDIAAGGAVLLESRYHVARFDEAMFGQFGIKRPASLANSVVSRRAEYVAGRALAQCALRHVGVRETEVSVASDRSPVWPQGVNGAISHSHGRCAIAVSANALTFVGVDTERFAHDDALDAILKFCIVPSERTLLDRNGAHELPQRATLVFSAKETLYKMLFPTVKQYFGFEAACVTEIVNDRELTLRLLQDLPGGHASGRQFTLFYEMDAEHVTTWGHAAFEHNIA